MPRYHAIIWRTVWYLCVAVATGALVFGIGLAVAGPGGANAGGADTGAARTGVSSPAGKSGATVETFSNPVLSTDVPGPSVIRDPATGTWYAYGGTAFWTGGQSSLHILPIEESRDLVHWTFVRNVFSKTGTTPAPGSPDQPAWTNASPLWTPDVHRIDSEYVMYYAASATTAGGVATASSPAGPWTDSGGPLVSPTIDPQGGVLDPSEFQAPDGQRYLYFGAFNYGIHVVELTANGLTIQPGSTPEQVAPPWIYDRAAVVYRDGYYYLFAASGSCCSGPNSESDEVVGRSNSPLGPFTDELGVPLQQGGMSVVVAGNGNGLIGPGGASLFQDGAQWWMALPVPSALELDPVADLELSLCARLIGDLVGLDGVRQAASARRRPVGWPAWYGCVHPASRSPRRRTWRSPDTTAVAAGRSRNCTPGASPCWAS